MPDLTIGEVQKVLQLNLFFIDYTQTPPKNTPLDLTFATSVQLSWVIVPPNQDSPPHVAPTSTVNMSILSPPVNGVVLYSFKAGDLVKPPTMGKFGQFRYTVKVTFNDGTILYPNFDGMLTIKDDSVL